MYKIFADDTLIYDSTLEEYKIGKGEITLELNKSGSFVFSLYPDHFYYGELVKLKTVITVYKDGRIVFRGRVLNDTTDYWNNKVCTCEGELGFFQDSIIRPFEFNGSPSDLLIKLVEEHNSQVDEFKRFKIGSVTVSDNNDYITRSNSAYETALTNLTKSCIESTLGGYLHITHENGEETPTLNWLGAFTEVSSQVVEFGENLKDYTKTVKADDIGTAIIPLGATVDDGKSDTEDPKLTIASVNDGKDYVYSESGVSLYGWIFKVVSWDDVTVAENLKAKAEEYLETLINQAITIELTAIDLHLMDKSIDSFKLGDYIRILSAPHNFDSVLLSNKQTLDLLNPANDTLTLGHSYYTFTDLNKNVSAVVQNVSTIRSSVSSLSNKMGNINATVIDASAKANAATESVNNLAGAVAGNAENIAILTEQMSSLSGGGIDYEIGVEVLTGNTWTDENGNVKPIYRYIWKGVSERSGSQGTYGSFPDGEPEMVINIRGMFQRPSDNAWFPIPTIYYGDINWAVNVRTSGSGQFTVGFGDEYPKTAKPMILIAEYTKAN